jgi:uncharacterized membrane protein YjjP (DUF1212 family)
VSRCEPAKSERSDPTSPTAPATGRGGEALLLELGRALHSYGTPAHRLEAALAGLASGAAARFFGGGPREIAASVVVGLAIGLLAVAAGRRPGDAPWIVAAGAIAFWGARGGAGLLVANVLVPARKAL